MAFHLNGLIGSKLRADALTIRSRIDRIDSIHPLGESGPDERDGYWWNSFVPKGIGLGAPIDTKADREKYRPRAEAMAEEVYRVFAERNDFRIAIPGWEISDAFYDPEETDFVDYGGIRIPECLSARVGLVVCDEIWHSLPFADQFEKFSDGYHWVPYPENHWDSPYTISVAR